MNEKIIIPEQPDLVYAFNHKLIEGDEKLLKA